MTRNNCFHNQNRAAELQFQASDDSYCDEYGLFIPLEMSKCNLLPGWQTFYHLLQSDTESAFNFLNTITEISYFREGALKIKQYFLLDRDNKHIINLLND